MIDGKYQKKGYGREVVRLALEYIRPWPGGKAEYCVLSYEPENTVAQRLYSSFGFEETGEISRGEAIAVLKLQPAHFRTSLTHYSMGGVRWTGN